MPTTTGKKKTKLNLRQVKFKKEYARTGNALQSALTAGYSKSFANQMSVRMSEDVRVGVEQEVEDFGLTQELIKTSLVEDIKAKPENRKPELELGAKILRIIGSEGSQTNVQVNISNILEKYDR